MLNFKGYLMAERMGFEPMKEFPLYTLSKRAPSTTRPPLLKNYLVVPNFLLYIYNFF